MSSRSLSRRTVATVGAATVVAAVGLTALVGTASAAACPTWTDPKGDATTGQEGVPNTEDAQMDITAASLGTVGDSLVATVTTDGLGGSSSDAGDEFGVRFTVAGQTIVAFADRIAPGGAPGPRSAGFLNETSETSIGDATATYDVAKKAVTITGKLTALATAAGKPVVGQVATGLEAYTATLVYVFPFVPYDDAPTTQTTTIGTACEFGGAAPAPAPTGTATTTAGPSASGSPSPSPSGSPSPSPSTTASGSPSPSTSGSPTGAPSGPGALVLPTPGCLLLTDDKGDVGLQGGAVPVTDPTLDLTGLTLRTTADALVGYVKVDKLALGPAMGTDGMRFSMTFTHNKNVFTASASSYKTAAAANIRSTLAQSGQFGANVQLGVNVPPLTDPMGRVSTGIVPSGLKAQFDLPSSYVVFTLPIADIVKYGMAPLAGASLTAVGGGSAMDTGALSSGTDSFVAAKPEDAVYRVGDNRCFSTPTVLTNVGVTTAQFSDTAKVAVKLADNTGKALAGQRVSISLPGSSAVVTTGADGVARLTSVMRSAAMTGTLTATFAAGAGFDKSAMSVPFRVTLERTSLLATGSRGAVTATLRDDDRQAVAGQVLTFTQGSVKKTARTDGKGVAKVGGFKPGQAVKITYAGLAGKYAATSLNARS